MKSTTSNEEYDNLSMFVRKTFVKVTDKEGAPFRICLEEYLRGKALLPLYDGWNRRIQFSFGEHRPINIPRNQLSESSRQMLDSRSSTYEI